MKRKKKAAATDYTKAMLPQNRKQIFFDVLQLQWRKLLLLGLLLLLFSLPLLLSAVAGDIYVGEYTAAAQAAGLGGEQGIAGGVLLFEMIRGAVNIVLFLLFLTGLSGALRVLRQLAWEENVYFPTEFFAGIKSNVGQLLPLGLLCGAVALLCRILLWFSASYRSGTVAAVSLVPLAVSVLVLLPAAAITLVMIPVYDNPLRANLKNAFYVYFSAPLRVLGTLAVCALFWVPALLPNVLCQVFGHIFAFFTLPVPLLGWTLFCYSRFDAGINQTHCPELVGRGIFRERETEPQPPEPENKPAAGNI